MIRTSIIMATRNHANLLRMTLDSIVQQNVPFSYEIVITDDGSTDGTKGLLETYPVRYFRLDKPAHGNPARALNNSMCEAHGSVLIKQSDDVVHVHPGTIAALTEILQDGQMCIASVQDWDVERAYVTDKQHVGPNNRIPLFFLGSCWRKDVCAVGGYDHDLFEGCLWYHDTWFADCMIHGLGVKVEYPPILGLHQKHQRIEDHNWAADKAVYEAAHRGKHYCSTSGPWSYREGISVNELERQEQ